MSSTIFCRVYKLIFAFFDLQAHLMLPIMALPLHAPHATAIHAIAGGYIDQANMLRICIKEPTTASTLACSPRAAATQPSAKTLPESQWLAHSSSLSRTAWSATQRPNR